MKKVLLIVSAICLFVTPVCFANDIGLYFDNLNDMTDVGSVMNMQTNNIQSLKDDEFVVTYKEMNDKVLKDKIDRFTEMQKSGEMPTARDMDEAFMYMIAMALSSLPIPDDSLYDEVNISWVYEPYGNNYVKLNSKMAVAEAFALIVGKSKKTVKGVLYGDREDGDEVISLSSMKFAADVSKGVFNYIWICYQYDDVYFLYSSSGKLLGYYNNGKVSTSNHELLNQKTIKTLKRILNEI